MSQFPVFLSVVFAVRNHSAMLAALLQEAEATISEVVSDYELIVVDNASDDDSIATRRIRSSWSVSACCLVRT